MSISKPPYPDEFRQRIVQLARDGRNLSDLAREFGCHKTSIQNWLRKSDTGTPTTQSIHIASELNAVERQELNSLRIKLKRQELNDLRRKQKQVQMELDNLAKAMRASSTR